MAHLNKLFCSLKNYGPNISILREEYSQLNRLINPTYSSHDNNSIIKSRFTRNSPLTSIKYYSTLFENTSIIRSKVHYHSNSMLTNKFKQTAMSLFPYSSSKFSTYTNPINEKIKKIKQSKNSKKRIEENLNSGGLPKYTPKTRHLGIIEPQTPTINNHRLTYENLSEISPIKFLNSKGSKNFDNRFNLIKVLHNVLAYSICVNTIGIHGLEGFKLLDLSRTLLSLNIHLTGVTITFMGLAHFALQLMRYSTSNQFVYGHFFSALRIGGTFMPILFALHSSASHALFGPYALYSLGIGLVSVMAMDFSSHKKELTPRWFWKNNIRSHLAIMTAIIFMLLSGVQDIEANRSTIYSYDALSHLSIKDDVV